MVNTSGLIMTVLIEVVQFIYVYNSYDGRSLGIIMCRYSYYQYHESGGLVMGGNSNSILDALSTKYDCRSQ